MLSDYVIDNYCRCFTEKKILDFSLYMLIFYSLKKWVCTIGKALFLGNLFFCLTCQYNLNIFFSSQTGYWMYLRIPFISAYSITAKIALAELKDRLILWGVCHPSLLYFFKWKLQCLFSLFYFDDKTQNHKLTYKSEFWFNGSLSCNIVFISIISHILLLYF